MTTDIRAALDAAEQHATAGVWAGHPLAIILAALIKQTRDALPAPAEGEVAELIAQLQSRHYGPAALDFAATLIQQQQAELARLRSAPVVVPVAVSERLPGVGDCDAEGRCWWGDAGDDEFVPSWRLCEQPDKSCFGRWLPTAAIPLPEGEVEG